MDDDDDDESSMVPIIFFVLRWIDLLEEVVINVWSLGLVHDLSCCSWSVSESSINDHITCETQKIESLRNLFFFFPNNLQIKSTKETKMIIQNL